MENRIKEKVESTRAMFSTLKSINKDDLKKRDDNDIPIVLIAVFCNIAVFVILAFFLVKLFL